MPHFRMRALNGQRLACERGEFLLEIFLIKILF